MTRTLSLLRYRDWAHFLCLPLLSLPLNPLQLSRLGLALLAAATYLAFAYGYNELHDRGWEALPAAELRDRIGLGPGAARLLWGALILSCLVSTALMGPWVAAVAAVGIGGSALYSGGPRLKRYPVLGTAANLWIFVPLLFFGGAPPPGPSFSILVAAFCALLLQSQLIHEASHRHEDERQHIRTTAVVFGPRVAKIVSVMMGLGACAAFTALALHASFALSLTSAVVVGLFTVASALVVDFSSTRATHRIRIAHRYLSLLAGGIAWAAMVWR